MDWHWLLFYLFAVVSCLYVGHLGAYLVTANLYDVWQYRRRHKLARSRSQNFRKIGTIVTQDGTEIDQPLVSICISAHNEASVIRRCLDSIRCSTYQNIEVIVADDASTDTTRLQVRDYQLRYPAFRLKVYRMKKNIGKGRALNAIMRRHAQGDLVMTLDADSIIGPHSVATAVAYFTDPSIAGVAANVQIIDEPTVLGMLQKFEHMVSYRSKKMYTLLNCEFVVGGVASTYRMEVLRRVGFYDTDTMTEDIGLSTKIVSLGNRQHRMVYGADVVAMTEGVLTFRALVKQRYRWKYGSFQNLIKYRRLIFNPSMRYTRTLTFYRFPMAILSEIALLFSPFIWAYILYMTLLQRDLTLVVGAYCTITAYTMLVVWFDENLALPSRWRLTVYGVTAYFIYYIMDLVQLVAIIRCAYNWYNLVHRHHASGVWTSPRRIGKQVVLQHET